MRRNLAGAAHPLRLGVLGWVIWALLIGSCSQAWAGSGAPDPVGDWPLRPVPEVVAPFDPPDNPYAAGHRGVDLLGRVGQQVRAALPGRVSYAGRLAGLGVVVVDHGSTRTTYQPVTASVSVGDPVDLGSVLGTLEASGSHCPPGACLHWGWLEGTTYLDPLRLVDAGPVRLLPLDGPGVGASRVPAGAVVNPPAPVERWTARMGAVSAYAGWLPLGLFVPAPVSPGTLAQARGCACW